MVSKDVCLAKFVFVSLSIISIQLVAPVSSAKILFIPVNFHSHVLYFSRLAADLADLGHVTRVVAPSSCRVPDFVAQLESDGNFSYVTYATGEPLANSRQMLEREMRYALSSSVWNRFTLMKDMRKDFEDHFEVDCSRLLQDDKVMQQIRVGGYQFAVMDRYATNCYFAVPYSLGIPYGILSTSWYAWSYRVPRFPSFCSSLGYTDRMTFSQRLTTFVFEMFLLQTMQHRRTTNYVERLIPDRPSPDVELLQQATSLWFFLEHTAVSYALPQMPNTVAVGDIMAERPRKPLPHQLEEFMSASNDGIIVVSFGSNVDLIPRDVVRKFCDALCDRRNRLRVIWKTNNTKLCPSVEERVMFVPWIPQNDLLADTRVQMFISHGGLNSIVESVYHAKPLIIFPVSSDQPTNAGAAEYRGFAIRMDIADFSSESLLSNIDRLLTDPTYKRNVDLASAVLRDRRDTPAQRVSAMIDHVIKYGDRHLRTGAFELSALQLMMFDIFVALVAVSIVVLLAVILICCCAYRIYCRSCCSRSKTKTE